MLSLAEKYGIKFTKSLKIILLVYTLLCMCVLIFACYLSTTSQNQTYKATAQLLFCEQETKNTFKCKTKLKFQSNLFRSQNYVSDITITDMNYSDEIKQEDIISKVHDRNIITLIIKDKKVLEFKSGEVIANVSFHVSFKPVFTTIAIYFLCIGVFLIWFLSTISKIDKYKLYSFFHTNWTNSLLNSYKNLDCTYKQSFFAILIIANTLFLYHSIQYLWGNHDWGLVQYGWWLEDSYYNARFTSTLLYQLLGGRSLPLISNAFALFGFSLSIILLAIYWQIPKTRFNFILLGLFFITCPFILSWFYYILNQITNFWILALVIGGLLLSLRKGVISHIFAISLFIFSLGSYAACLNTMLVVFGARIFFHYYFSTTNLRSVLFLYKQTFINIIVSLLLFKLILTYLKAIGKTLDLYNNEITPLHEMAPKFFAMLQASLKQFCVTYPFLDYSYMFILLAFMCVALLSFLTFSIKENTFIKTITCCILLLGILFATKISAFLSSDKEAVYATRIDFFGLLFVYGFGIAFMLKQKTNIVKNILLVFMIFIIPMGAFRIVEAQKVWKLGFEAEKHMVYEILDQFKEKSSFKPNNEYTLVAIGAMQGFRPFYFPYKDYANDEPNHLHRTYLAEWAPGGMFAFYAPDINIARDVQLARFKPENKSARQILYDLKDFILHKAETYPSKNSIYVDDKYLVIIWDKEGLERLRHYLQENEEMYPF